MKIIFLITTAVFFSLITLASDPDSLRTKNSVAGLNRKNNEDPEKVRTIYLGVGTGINNNSGIIGPSLEFGIANRASVFGAVGIGTWGAKVTGGARYYFSFPRKAAFGISYSYIGGASSVTSQLDVVDSATGGTKKQNVTFKCKPAATLNLTFLYFWKLGKHNRFNLEVGYAVPLQGMDYVVLSNVQLTSTSKDALNILQPGGVILAASFSFGLH